MDRLRRPWVLALALLLLLLFFVPPLISITRYNRELESALSNALGRRVSFRGGVRVRLLPQPGLQMRDFIIAEDAEFGAEPMLRAPEATAHLRLTSLWRGKLEIARFSFDYPSLNLVRGAGGRWNIQSLLQRASEVRTAPTTRVKPLSIPRFPYIEADSGRLNFKLGLEKQPFALLDADFALWRESEEQWNMRIEGRPARTNVYLTDTGIFRAEGNFHPSAGQSLRTAPFELRATLRESQFGQLSLLLTGRDYGWRAGVDAESTLKGTLERFALDSRVDVRDFRRFDIGATGSTFARIQCRSNVVAESAQRAMRDLDCSVPVRDGHVKLSGWTSMPPLAAHDLRLRLENLPMAAAAVVFRRAKLGVPEDFSAAGIANGEFILQNHDLRRPVATGSGKVSGLRVQSEQQKGDFAIGDLGIRLQSVGGRRGRTPPLAQAWMLTVDPLRVDLGGTSPATVNLRLDPGRTHLRARGDAPLARLLAAAKMFGLLERDYRGTGDIAFDATVDGRWGFVPVSINGRARLAGVALEVAEGTPVPLRLESADVSMQPRTVSIAGARGTAAGSAFSGSMQLRRACEPAVCPATFDLRVAALDFDALNRELNPSYRQSDWLALPRRLIGGETKRDNAFMRWHARGKIVADRVSMKNVIAHDVSADAELAAGLITLNNVRGEVLNGRHIGSWTLDFRPAEPAHAGKGVIDSADATMLSTALRESFRGGDLSGTYDVSLRGDSAPELWRSASGSLAFTWKHGTLVGALYRGAPLSFSSWTGQAAIQDAGISLSAGRMQTAGDDYVTTGNVGFDRTVSLTLAGERQRLAITGTLANARVTATDAVREGGQRASK